MRAMRNLAILPFLALLLATIAGCHGSSAASGSSRPTASFTDPNNLVESAPLSRDSMKGGPMPPQAQKIFAEKMAEVGIKAAAARAAQAAPRD